MCIPALWKGVVIHATLWICVLSWVQEDAIAKDEQQQKVSLTRRLQHASEVRKQVQEI